MIDNKEFWISLLETSLNVTLPNVYKKFLSERGSKIIDGFKVIGFPTKEIPITVFNGYEIIRQKRDDLPRTFMPIIFSGTYACCLDLTQATEEDAPLVDVDLDNNNPPKPLGETFSEWI